MKNKLWHWLGLAVGLLFSLACRAAEPEAATQASNQSSSSSMPVSSSLSGTLPTGQIMQLLFGLLLILGLIFVLAWLARRLQQQLPGGNQADVIRLVATRSLGPRERLLLVQVGSEQVLLGLTPGTIEPLHVMQEPVIIAEKDIKTGGDFAQRLKQALHQPGKKNNEDS